MKIELLSPAKNLECGIVAVNHGADAVYIGASHFGARAAAGNSIHDIEALVKYAHQFRVKVYVALNTLLTDEQLLQAEKLIWDIYSTGADALIIQDMGILQMNLPPIPLHASTQTDNRTPEKVKFLEKSGFSRVVLARELNLEQIKTIRSQTEIELEAFVHGALCVSYSGQCYMSEAMCGRSANRGQCAQYCRLPYQLLDADGKLILKNKHLLSLKDLDQSESLEEMIEAGIHSFKIEGRLKDMEYVKNITAYYRKKLDVIIETNDHLQRSSSGKTHILFEPNPEKSFRRNSTDYFLHGRQKGIFQPETPKSMGEPIGKVTYTGRNFFEMKNYEQLNNGDGLCFVNKQGELTGFRVNKVEGKQVFPANMPRIEAGIFIYRNQDQAFDKILKGKTSERKVAIDICFNETKSGFEIRLTDEDGISSTIHFDFEKQIAQKPDNVLDNVKNQLSKLGNTIFEMRNIDINIQSMWFFPASTLSEWRRQAIEQLMGIRENSYTRELRKTPEKAVFPTKELTYTGNVTNQLAEKFYKGNGVEKVEYGFEVKARDNVPLMFTKHCIKYEMGWCPREGNQPDFREPFFLRNNDQSFQLRFDCNKCEMQISVAQKS